MKRVLLIFSIPFLVIGIVNGQDPLLTQYYANSLYLNPAFAGANRCPKLTVSYRNQWPRIALPYQTYIASYDQEVKSIGGGLGLLVINDIASNGVVKAQTLNLLYSYKIPISRKLSLRAGATVSYFQRAVDWSELKFGDQIDPRYGFIYQTQEVVGLNSINGADFSTGFLIYSDDFFGGVAVDHLTEPNQSFFKTQDAVIKRKYTVHMGANLYFNKRFKEYGYISPNFLFQQQGGVQQYNMGLYVVYNALVGGVSYRWKDSFITIVGIQKNGVKIGYSYDLTVSDLGINAGGSHEVSLTYQFKCRQKIKKLKPIPCPKF